MLISLLALSYFPQKGENIPVLGRRRHIQLISRKIQRYNITSLLRECAALDVYTLFSVHMDPMIAKCRALCCVPSTHQLVELLQQLCKLDS